MRHRIKAAVVAALIALAGMAAAGVAAGPDYYHDIRQPNPQAYYHDLAPRPDCCPDYYHDM